MKVYVTKYALTAGILEKEAEPATATEGGILVRGNKTRSWSADEYYHGRDWHTDREAAVLRAQEMRNAKIASVKKQLAKLEAMTF